MNLKGFFTARQYEGNSPGRGVQMIAVSFWFFIMILLASGRLAQ
jgi:hypothetical protein